MNPNMNDPQRQNQPDYNRAMPVYNTAPSDTPFNDSEWKLLVETPLKTCITMIAVSPSGPIGMIQEAKAVSDSLKGMSNQAGTQSPVMRELAQHIQSTVDAARSGGSNPFGDLQKTFKDADGAKTDAIASCQQCVTLLRNTSPQDVNNYSEFVYGLAYKVAQAAREGGFLGIGGQQISDGEQVFLNQLRAVLNIQHS